MDFFHSHSPGIIALVFLAAFLLGLNKAGLKGVDMMNVTIMAIVFQSKASTGIVLPLLCVADVLAVIYYHRHAQWAHFWKLIPWMIVGILLSVYFGRGFDEAVFRKIMALIIVSTAVIMILLEFRKTRVPDNKVFASTMGLISGVTTMFGNLAGAFSNIYFIAIRLPKNDFIGTAAWIFLFINFFKLPFQAFYWNNINAETLKIDLYLLPAMVAGFWVGVKLVAKIKDYGYRKVVIGLVLIGAIIIFLQS